MLVLYDQHPEHLAFLGLEIIVPVLGFRGDEDLKFLSCDTRNFGDGFAEGVVECRREGRARVLEGVEDRHRGGVS